MAKKKETDEKDPVFMKVMKTLFPAWWEEPEEGDKSKVELTFEDIMGVNHRAMWEFFEKMTETSKDKKNKTTDYENMILDPVCKGALELLAEDTFQINEEGESIGVEVKKNRKKVGLLIEDLFNRISIEERLEDWTYIVPFYGEMPVLIRGKDDEGITSLMDSVHPLDFWRIDVGTLFAFLTNYEKTGKGERKILPPWEMVHFRFKMNRQRDTIDKRIKVKIDDKEIYLENNQVEGYLEGVRYIHKNLRLLEDSLILARMDRAPLKRVFYIDVGDSDPEARLKIIRDFKQNYKKEVKFNVDDYYKSQNNPMTFGQELFIPISEQVKGINVEEYGGKVDVEHIVDIEYMRAKFFAGLKIPKAFLGLEEDLPGSLGESALVRLEIRYARTVKANRRAILNGIFRLCQIECAYHGEEIKRDDIEIYGNYISSAEEEEKYAATSGRMDLVNDFIGLFRDMGIDVEKDVNKEYFYDFVFKDLLKLTDLDLKTFFQVAKGEDEEAQETKRELKRYVSDCIGPKRIYDSKAYTWMQKDKWIIDFSKIFPNDVKNINNFGDFVEQRERLSDRIKVGDEGAKEKPKSTRRKSRKIDKRS